MSRKEISIGLALALIVALFLSPLASTAPDGLEKVAKDYGFMDKEEGTSVFKAPLPGYTLPGFKNEKLAASVLALLGTVIIFGIGYSLALLLKKRKN